MTEWALGSLAAYNALPAATQARFAARYDTLWLAWQGLQAIDNPLGGDYSLVYIEDVTEPTWGGTIAACTIVNTFVSPLRTIEVTALNRSIVVTHTDANDFLLVQSSTSALRFIVHGFSIEKTFSVGSFAFGIRVAYGDGSGLLYGYADVYDMSICQLDPTASGSSLWLGLPGLGATQGHQVRVWNCILSNGGHAIEIENPASKGILLVDNVSAYHSNTPSANEGVYGSLLVPANWANYDFTNIAIAGYDSDWSNTAITSNADFKNCASADTSAPGTDPQISITPATEFKSLTYGEADYLKLDTAIKKSPVVSATPHLGRAPLSVKFNGDVAIQFPSGQLAVAGTEPAISENTEDFAGEPRPTIGGTYAIGCYEPDFQCADVVI